ncbi:hypothetical protein LPJ53_001863 [Coemansia erecta]|uniref:Uncharacterized protein n=1 Tax=Coemansia erecta TaxID=147472 RepID=A0A9W8CUG8_9FUNG|nr:hypothetical protein LPJ53_001863 [Coemansia erecta]
MDTSKQYKELTGSLFTIINALPAKVRKEFISILIDAHAPLSADHSSSENSGEFDYSEDESVRSDDTSINEMTFELDRGHFCFFRDTVTIMATKPKGVLYLEKTNRGGFKVIHTIKQSKKRYAFIVDSIDEQAAIKHLDKIGWSNLTSSVVWCTCVKRDAGKSSKAKSAKLCLLRRILTATNSDVALVHINSLKRLVASQD